MQRLLHLIEFEGFDDRFDLFHVVPIRAWLFADRFLTRTVPSLKVVAANDPCRLKTQG
jgi:hypothetical protein